MTTVEKVRRLVRNVEPVDDAFIEAAILTAVDTIRGRLSRLYPHLKDTDTTPPLPTIATFLAAALAQANTLSLTQVGGTQNPFALQLYNTAMEQLNHLAQGHTVLIGHDPGMMPAFAEVTPSDIAEAGLGIRAIRQHRGTGPK